MVNIKKLSFYSFLFILLFTVVGDSYIYYVDGETFESDFLYETDIDDKKLKREYLEELESFSKDNEIKIYIVSTDITSNNAATYTIYTTEKDKEYFKKRILVKKDHTRFYSVLSGNREIKFKPFKDSVNSGENKYYVFGSKDAMEKLRSQTIDKYGMSKPYDNHYPNDAPFMIGCAWIFIFLIIFIYTIFEVSHLKKEVLLKILNGMDKRGVIAPLIIKNSILIGISAVIGMGAASFLTEAYKFMYVSLGILLLLIILTGASYLILLKLDVKRTFVRSNYSVGYKALAFIVLTVITISLVTTLTFNVKTIYDAVLTLNQKGDWEKFYKYDSVFFQFKDHTELTNSSTDEEHSIQFYNEYLNQYKIYLAFDFANNGGFASTSLEGKESYVYLNKFAKEQIEDLGIDIKKIKEDNYYIISLYSDEELKDRGIYEEGKVREVNHLLDIDKDTFKTLRLKEGFTFLVYDINMNNLADNIKSNPVLILDTHDKLPSKTFSRHVFNSLIRFNHSSDFNSFIEKIGYEDEVYYKKNVEELYQEKRSEKMLTMVINIIVSTMLMILFTISLSTILKMDFDSRAVEIALNKVHGKTLFKRYKGLFRLLSAGFIVGVMIALSGKWFLYNFYVSYSLIASVIVLITIFIVVTWFINKYEKKSIPRILKGGN